ncbi:hypothetical protein F9C07_2276790 [Aspergillus flavus]|uniref:protein S-acyltransferase n=1 Tax=Aspergillus flavus (strain ATCC 200026 / FGSC A1120 / IAM 13836 / NRRL 3357 / JCM 12722 / SRRC 167) TaxID=332952 RepID=A0A7U2MCT8_ASPFN|nr:hypothetical protein F9C07_2276790 [Aspergillus flavus]
MLLVLPSQCTLTAFGKYASAKQLLSDSDTLMEYINCANDEDDTPLQLAARNGQSAVVELLVYIISLTGCQYPDQSFTPLLLAAIYGQESVVKMLLEQGADEVEWCEWNVEANDLGKRKMASCHPF